jgi:site-specific recombinase XerD
MDTGKNMTVAEVIAAASAQLTQKGYSDHYRETIRGIHHRFAEFCEERGEKYYRTALGQQFYAERYDGDRVREDRRNLVNRALQILADIQEFGSLVIRRRLEREFPTQFIDACSAYLGYLRRNQFSANTIKNQTHSLHNLTEFLDAIGVTSVSCLTLAHMDNYIKSALCNYCRSSAATRVRDAKKFLSFLFEDGRIADDIASKMMKVPTSAAPVFLPSAFKSEDVELLLATMDKRSPVGKRDYAAILLAAKTGLRLSDIQNLKFENLDWEKRVISLTQVKTKEPLVLSLAPDVGWALIDYIKHGRPISDSHHIFLRERAPYVPLQNFDNILIKHLRLAGISVQYVRHHGLHALRHSLATTLLEQQTPIHVIQGILGHVNMQTTQQYTDVDVRQLKECALEAPEV